MDCVPTEANLFDASSFCRNVRFFPTAEGEFASVRHLLRLRQIFQNLLRGWKGTQIWDGIFIFGLLAFSVSFEIPYGSPLYPHSVIVLTCCLPLSSGPRTRLPRWPAALLRKKQANTHLYGNWFNEQRRSRGKLNCSCARRRNKYEKQTHLFLANFYGALLC